MIKCRTLDADENLYLKSAIDITFFCFTCKSVRSAWLICISFSSIRSKIADNVLMMIIQFTVSLFHLFLQKWKYQL